MGQDYQGGKHYAAIKRGGCHEDAVWCLRCGDVCRHCGRWLIGIGGEDNFVTAFAPSKYFILVTYMMLAFGIGFEFPILLVFLQMANIVSPQQLSSVRRYAVVGILVLVAVITPSGDPISMLMLSVPMVLFYEVSILIGRLLRRRQPTTA